VNFGFEFLNIHMNEKTTTCHDCHGFKWQNINIYPIFTIYLCGLTLFLARWIVTTPMCSEITIKGTKGTKVKVFFQGLHMACVIFVLVYNLKFVFQIPHLTFHFDYKLILYHVYYHSCLLSHI
jgi:hypothetical protein